MKLLLATLLNLAAGVFAAPVADDGVKPCLGPQKFECTFNEVIPMYKIEITEAKLVFDGTTQRTFTHQKMLVGGVKAELITVVHFKEKIAYSVNLGTGQCTRTALTYPFIPAGVPPNSKFLREAYIGAEEIAKGGLQIQSWKGHTPELNATFIGTWTKHGCLQVSFDVSDSTVGPFKAYFYDYKLGIRDPSVLEVPKECKKFTKADSTKFKFKSGNRVY